MNRVPSFIIIHNTPTGTNDVSINHAIASSADEELFCCSPPPPALERWTSEGSATTDCAIHCQAPIPPVRRSSEGKVKVFGSLRMALKTQPETTKLTSSSATPTSSAAAPRLPRRRCSTYAPSSLLDDDDDCDCEHMQLRSGADRWN